MSAVHNSPSSGSIRFLTGPLAGKTFQINKPITTFGRDATNDIVVKGDQKVSRSHARLLWNNGSWSIEKLAPQNILTVNQQQVQQASISDNSTIGLGDDTTFLFLIRAEVQATPPQPQPVYPSYQQAAPPQYSVEAQQRSFPAPPPQQQQFQQAFQQPPAPPYPPGAQQQPFQMRTTGLNARPDETQIASPTSIGLPSLEVSSNIHGSRQSFPLVKDVVNIGRDTKNDIVIREGSIISGQHLQILRQGNQFVLIHPHPDRQGTVNGLLYQGRKIRGDEPFRKTLNRGDIFRIGDENGTLITLVFNDGTGTQQEILAPVRPIRLGDPELSIGRKPDNTVVLSHPQVSGHHARMVREGGTYRILDLNSTNHVYVNSELTTNHLLKLGDEIRIGPYKLVYEANQLTQYDESNFIRIDALNLKKTGNNNVTLLSNLSFSIPPRKFVALVGGSGAGKSTLMDALNGLRPAQEGKVLYNGQDYYRNLAAFSTQLGYVPQDDIIHRDLTVERALYYAAKLRLPSDFTDEQIQQRINEVLEDVELTVRRKLLIKKLSGGQRKRVSIALELLANPSVFFLDEPTSGLDPGLDRKMMYLLRKLADKGHTIVLVTHATNNINSCDYVCFLCQGGHLAYFGPPEEAKAYFGKTDFAEIYSSLEPTEENRNIPEEAEARFKVSKQYQEYVLEPLKSGTGETAGIDGRPKVQELKRPKRGNPFKQFILLFQRQIELFRNNTSNLILLFLQAPLIGLVLVLIVRAEIGTGIFDANKVVLCAPQIFQTTVTTNPQAPAGSSQPLGINTNGNTSSVDCNRIITFLKTDTNGQQYVTKKANGNVNKALQDFILTGGGSLAQIALFIVSFIAVMFGTVNGIREIVKENAIYRRERTVNLGIFPYLLSKVIVLGVISLIQSAELLLIIEIFEPLHQGVFLPVLLECYIAVALAGLAGMMIGLAASAFSANEDSATSLIPFLLIPQIIFAGSEIPLKDYVLQTLSVFFPARWAIVALGSSVGIHSDKLGGDSLFGSDPSYHGTLFSTFSQTDATQRVLLAWAALGAIVLVLTVVTAIGLKRKDIRA